MTGQLQKAYIQFMQTEKRSILKCRRCGWTWAPKKGGTPGTCAKCRSPYWNKPREKEAAK